MNTKHSPSPSSQGLSQLDDFMVRDAGHATPLIYRGIEKEGLRATLDDSIAQTNHPRPLGHPLTHPSITTDYSEALLELITPVEPSREALMKTLSELHYFVQHNIEDEVIWVGSMPCRLDGHNSIRIAEYGDSNIGQLKHVYRQGLGVRYGRIMQSIAGLHFNFSLDDDFWLQRKNAMGETSSLQDFKSEQYFGLIRNFRRHAWLLMYLFGASPVLDSSFLNGAEHNLERFDDKGSFYKPFATSLRMGDLGYHNNAQASLAICFNTLTNFTTTLGQAIRTSYPAYEKIGLTRGDQFIQLNTNILQIENEYYSSIRPKRTTFSGERPTQALMQRGVEYVEVRCLDLNPFLPEGISEQQIDFLDLFLLHCLLTDSPFISDEDCSTIDTNFSLAVNEGRKPGLKLNNRGAEISLQDWGKELLDAMQPIADILDRNTHDHRYSNALIEQLNKIAAPDLTPSAQVIAVMQQEGLSWIEFAGELSRKHKAHFLGEQAKHYPKKTEELRAQSESSFTDAAAIKAGDTQTFADFLTAYQAN